MSERHSASQQAQGRNPKNSSDGNKGGSQRSNAHSRVYHSSQQRTGDGGSVQGQGGSRPQNQRSDGASTSRENQPSTSSHQGAGDRRQFQGRGGSRPQNQRPEGASNESNFQRRDNQSSTVHQGSGDRRQFQGRGGSRPQNQRPEGASDESNFQRRDGQSSTFHQGIGDRSNFERREYQSTHQGQGSSRPKRIHDHHNQQRPQYGGNRGGSRGGFVDRKGKIDHSDEKPPHLKPMKTSSGQKWKSFPSKQDEIKIPVRPGAAKESERIISLRVNYFPLKIKLPDTIYHYVVDINQVMDENQTTRKPLKPKKSQSKDEPSVKKVLPKYLRFAIHKKLVNQLRGAFLKSNPGQTVGIISDRSNALYSTKKLDLSVNLEQFVEISSNEEESNGRQQNFRVTVAPTIEKVDTKGLQQSINDMKGRPITSDLQTLDRVYNTLMKNLSCSRFVPIGRSSLICFEDSTGYRLGEGLLNFQGYNATIEITNGWKPFLNVHVANCATLLNKNVIEVFADLFNRSTKECRTIRGWKPYDFKTASNLLSTCKVRYSPDGKNAKILGGTVVKVITQSISMKKFSIEDSDGKKRQTSIYDYYVERYGRKDLEKDGPCLELNGEKFVPAEICEVKKGQSINRKLTDNQTTAMIKCAKKSPDVLEKEIEQSIANLNLQNDPILKQFGCSFEGDISLLQLPQTRKLADPLLCYSKARVTPANGVWDSYALKAKFLNAVDITKWGILYTCKGYKQSDLSRSQSNFVNRLIGVANVAGVRMNPQPTVIDLSNALREREDAAMQNIEVLTDCFKQKFHDCEIVLVVVPGKSSHLYCHVKQASEIETGNLTQCVTANSFTADPNRIGSIVENIILKVNSKLGGINHTVVNPSTAIPFTLFEAPVMIVGADVTHGGCDGGNSYAAVTCTIHNSGIQYMMHVQAQQRAKKGAAEVIQNFDVIIKKCLQAYRFRTRCSEYPDGLIPTKIIYLRDGVGAGQFPELLHSEMRSMRNACTSISSTYQPAITFITVQKRHKTRFFMQKNGVTTEENAPPGTVVDTIIVHPTENDFYLLSHQGIKGSTTRPTHYHTLWDDSNFSADQIQQLVYYLCYMYVRCNRSVSIPAPTYYAHHAATRASILAQGHTGTIEEINAMLLRTPLSDNSPMHFV